MMIGVIVALLLLGVLLLLLEIVFVPGTTIVGIGGAVLLAIGVYLAYGVSSTAGHLSLLASLFAVLAGLGIMLKTRTWERLALKDSVSSRSPLNPEAALLKEGDRGRTVGRLNPSGKATFGDLIAEVHTNGELIGPDTEVEVVKVSPSSVQVRTAA